MISIQEDGEFTHTIADVIEKLSAMDIFTVKVWVSNSELAFEFDESCDVHFLNESIRITKESGRVTYIALDTVVSINIYPYHLWMEVTL